MANELQEFLKLLGKIITWIILWTLNLICFCLFLISLIALWRTYWIIKDVTSSSSMSRFRESATAQFFLIILDIIILPFGIIGFVIPTRTYHIITDLDKEIHKSFSNRHYPGKASLYCQSARVCLFINFWIGLGDIFCLFFGLISIIVPTRTIAFFRASYHYRHNYLNDRYGDLRISWIANFAMAIADIIAIPHGILALFLPTRTYLICTQFIDIYNDIVDSRPSIWRRDIIGPDILDYNASYRVCAVINFWIGLLDLIVLVVMPVISCIFVVRIWELIKLYTRYATDYKADKYGTLRIAVCAHFILSIIDLLCFIAGILVCITLVRSYPLMKDVQSYFKDKVSDDDLILQDIRINYNLKLRQKVFKHFTFLFLDILFVPLMILCCLSVYHGIEIYHLIIDATVFDEHRMNRIRRQVLVNFAFLVFDVLFMLPLCIVILVTVYRFNALYKHIKYGWNVYYFNRDIDDTMEERESLLGSDGNHRMKEPENCRIHIVMNVLVILCDILFIVIAIILICVTGYRIPYLIGILRENMVMDAVNRDDFMEEYRAIWRQRVDIFRTGFFIFIDIPCFIMCLVVFITIWRAFKMYDLLKNQTNDTYEFRMHSWIQFWSLIRDILFLIPFTLIIISIFRLPMLILGIMSKLRTPRTNINDTIHLTIDECSLEFPEKGKPMIHVKRGRKALHFGLNNENAKKKYCRLFVLGVDFWKEVEIVFGSSIATAAQSMLPNKLSNGSSNGFVYDDIYDGNTDINDICFTLQTPMIDRKSILDNVKKFTNRNTPLIFQLEHDDEGILFIICLSIDDLIRCAANDDGLLKLQRNKHFGVSVQEINTIRGEEFLGIVDMFWVIVGIEFVKWLQDVIHLILFLILFMCPWRWIQCIYYLCAHQTKWYLREESFVIGILEHGYFIYVKLYDLLFEPMLNDMVKIKYTSNTRSIEYQKWCDKIEKYWAEYGDELQVYSDSNEESIKYMNFITLGLSTYDYTVKNAIKKLKDDIKPLPAAKELIMDLFDIQNIRIYLKVMESKMNENVMNNEISWENQSIFMEQLHVEQEHYKQRMIHLYNTIHESHNQFKERTKQYKNVKCAICSKNLSLIQKIIRFFVLKSITDVLIITMLIGVVILSYLPFISDGIIYDKDHNISILWCILYYIGILCIVYYIIPFRNLIKLAKFKYYIRDSELRFGFKQVMLHHLKDVLQDVLQLFVLCLLSILITITMVRLFEYISELVDGGRKKGRNIMTIRLALEIAQSEASQICGDLWQIFGLFIAWKTYKFAIASLVFGLFLPAAGFLEIFAMVCVRCPRKWRQIAGIILWFGLLAVVLYVSIALDPNSITFYILCIITVGICTTFFIALFGCNQRNKMINDGDSLFRRETRLDEKIDYGSYYTNKLCDECNVRCERFDNTPWSVSRKCKICDRYLWHNDRSYFCSKCEKITCVPCSNIVLKPAEILNSTTIEQQGNTIASVLWSFPNDEYISYWIRLTWPNIIAFSGIILDFVLMISILFYIFYIESTFSITTSTVMNDLYSNDFILKQFVSISKTLLLNAENESQFMWISVITIVIGGIWVILVSLPLVVEQLFNWVQKRGTFTTSTTWIKITWLYKVFFVVIVISLMKLFQCDDECIIISSYSQTYDGMSVTGFVLLIFFWLTSLTVLVYNHAQIVWTRKDHLDIRYPLAFIHGLQILQSLFIISGMLIVLTNAQIAILLCMMLSWIMLLWHCIIYPLISKYMVNNDNYIHSFTSISYLIPLQITLYVVLVYISTLLYLYLYVFGISNAPNIGNMLLYGMTIIICIGLCIVMITRYIVYRNRLKQLHELSNLNKVIETLTQLYETTSKQGSMGDWYQKIGKNKLEKVTNNAWSTTTDLAYLLIEFERHIKYDRLNRNFLQNRNDWILSLLSCNTGSNSDFDHFIPLIDTLRDSIICPPFFTLCMNALSQESELFSTAPLDICLLIMEFVVPCAEIRFIAKHTLLHSEQFPKFDQVNIKKGIISRMKTFGHQCGDKLKKFQNDIKEAEQYIESVNKMKLTRSLT